MKKYTHNFFILLCAMTIGWLALLPYFSSAINKPLNAAIVILGLLKVTIVNALMIGFGLLLSKKVGCSLTKLSDSSMHEIKNKLIKPGLIGGIFVGFAILFIELFIFRSSFEVYISPFYGLLASLYGAINEEIITRLFFHSLIVWFLQKIMPAEQRKITYWIGIILSSLLFGLAHLPTAAQMGSLTLFIVSRVLILNGLGGIIFGYLFWRYGLLTSMFAHFIADIILHVIPYFFF